MLMCICRSQAACSARSSDSRISSPRTSNSLGDLPPRRSVSVRPRAFRACGVKKFDQPSDLPIPGSALADRPGDRDGSRSEVSIGGGTNTGRPRFRACARASRRPDGDP
jgi:hypothetical protein